MSLCLLTIACPFSRNTNPLQGRTACPPSETSLDSRFMSGLDIYKQFHINFVFLLRDLSLWPAQVLVQSSREDGCRHCFRLNMCA